MAVAPGLGNVMAQASGRGDPYTSSSVRHSSRHRTPSSRDERKGYRTPEQAGWGSGRVGVVVKRFRGSKTLPLLASTIFSCPASKPICVHTNTGMCCEMCVPWRKRHLVEIFYDLGVVLFQFATLNLSRALTTLTLFLS